MKRYLLIFAAVLMCAASAFAAQQTISLGSAPDGAGGDNNRQAFTKVNSNFTELYTAPVVATSWTIGASGVIITHDSDGAFTIAGLGNGSDENLTFNFDDTPDTVVVTSSSGVTVIQYTSIDLQVPTEAYDATGWNGDNTVPTKDAVRDELELKAPKANPTFTGTVEAATVNVTALNTSAFQLGEGGKIALDPAGSADGAFSGVTVTGTAGATLAFGDVIVLDPTDSRWELADANAASGADGDSRGMIGVCVQAAAADGSATTILLVGIVRADAAFPSFTVNAPVYVSETAGDATGTSPTTEDNVVRALGFAMTADEIYFNPSATWITYDAP